MRPKTILIILTILVLTLTLILTEIPSKITNKKDNYQYTKALCNDSNYCEDYIIECSGKELKRFSPTGMVIQKKENWNDPRENPEELCN
jgi:hypothetical protein